MTSKRAWKHQIWLHLAAQMDGSQVDDLFGYDVFTDMSEADEGRFREAWAEVSDELWRKSGPSSAS